MEAEYEFYNNLYRTGNQHESCSKKELKKLRLAVLLNNLKVDLTGGTTASHPAPRDGGGLRPRGLDEPALLLVPAGGTAAASLESASSTSID